MRIHLRLWIICTSIFLSVEIILYFIVTITYEKQLQAGYTEVAIAKALSINERLADTYPDSPLRTMGYLKSYSKQLNSRLIILDETKKIFADSFQQLQKDAKLNLAILDKNSFPASIFIKTAPYGYVQYTMIPLSENKDGYLLIIDDANELYEEIKSFQKWLIITLLSVILVFFVIAYFVSRWFTLPIRQIILRLKTITPYRRNFYLNYPHNDEIKELIKAMQSMVEQLNIYDARQRRFLSTSSHELKTPLTTMYLILENLPYVRDNDESFHEFIHDLMIQVKKMKRMVEQLLQITKIEDLFIQKEKITTHDIKSHLHTTFQYLSQSKQIYLQFEMEDISIYVDRSLFLHALDNLVANGIQYSPNGSIVSISVKKWSENCIISICDQGIGISDADINHIFEPFFRVNDATEWNQEGSGLGLSIVKQIVDSHQGRIEIESELEQGTCIRIIL